MVSRGVPACLAGGKAGPLRVNRLDGRETLPAPEVETRSVRRTEVWGISRSCASERPFGFSAFQRAPCSLARVFCVRSFILFFLFWGERSRGAPGVGVVPCQGSVRSARGQWTGARAFDGTLEDSHGEPSCVRKTTVCFDKNRADPWLKRPSLTLSSMP